MLNENLRHSHSGRAGDGNRISYRDLIDTPTRGTITLVAGVGVVTTQKINQNSLVFLSVNGLGGTVGYIYEDTPNRNIGVSFTIKSTSTTDTSTIAWIIYN